MQRFNRFPFKIASLIVTSLPFILLCAPRREPAPVDTETTLTVEEMARAESIYDRAVNSYEEEKWSVAANDFDRLLENFPETIFTRSALILATKADLESDNSERAWQRVFDFRDYILRDISKKTPLSGGPDVILSGVVRQYADAGMQGEGMRLMLEFVPDDMKATDLKDDIFRTAEYLAYQLPRENLIQLIDSNADHPLTPKLQIHLARQVLAEGESDLAATYLSEIRTRSLRPEDRALVDELRSTASGKVVLEGKVALLLPLTGSFSQYAQAVLKGVQLALHPPAGEPETGLGLEVFDTGGEFPDLMKTVDEIMDDPELLAVIGPLSSSLTVSISRKLQGEKLTLISPTASERGINDLGKNIFSLNFVDESLATRIAEFAVIDLGLKQIASIFPMDDYGYRMVKAFIGRVEELGGEVVVAQGYPISATTFDSELKRIAYYSPEAIFIPAHSEEIPLIAPQITFYGMDDVQLLGTSGWNNRRVARLGEKYVEGAFFTDTFFESSPRIGYREFSRRYEDAYKEEASRVAGLGYDAVNLIIRGLQAGGGGRYSRSTDFSDLVYYRGATAVYSMTDDGYFRKEPLLLTISGGKIRAIEDLPWELEPEEEEEELPPVNPLDIQNQAID